MIYVHIFYGYLGILTGYSFAGSVRGGAPVGGSGSVGPGGAYPSKLKQNKANPVHTSEKGMFMDQHLNS